MKAGGSSADGEAIVGVMPRGFFSVGRRGAVAHGTVSTHRIVGAE